MPKERATKVGAPCAGGAGDPYAQRKEPEKILVALRTPGLDSPDSLKVLHVVAKLDPGKRPKAAIKNIARQITGAGFNGHRHAVETVTSVLGEISTTGAVLSADFDSSSHVSVRSLAERNGCDTYIAITVSPNGAGHVVINGVTTNGRLQAVFSRRFEYRDLGLPVPSDLSTELTVPIAHARVDGNLDAALSAVTCDQFCEELCIDPSDLTKIDMDYIADIVALNE